MEEVALLTWPHRLGIVAEISYTVIVKAVSSDESLANFVDRNAGSQYTLSLSSMNRNGSWLISPRILGLRSDNQPSKR